MRSKFMFISLIIFFFLCSVPWAQSLKPLTFSRKTLYHDFGMNDSIKIHNPNRIEIILDSVEIWNENQAEGSLISINFQSDIFNKRVKFYLRSASKAIQQGIFVWSRTDSLKDTRIAIKANGDTWISGFQIDRCPVCKQSAGNAIMDTLQFKLILHHSLGADSIQVITDNRIGLAIKPTIRNSNKRVGLGERSFDFLGRQSKVPNIGTVSEIAF